MIKKQMKQEINKYIAAKAKMLYKLSDDIWDASETAFEEYRSAKLICDALEQEGFEVTQGLAGIETAFSGKAGTGKPVIGILGEFDALSGLSQEAGVIEKKEREGVDTGHGCGHNLLGAGSLAAAMGIKIYLEENKCPGTVIYYGCPGEEGGSGKTFMARDGVFNGLDFALGWHPAFYNMVWPVSTLANCQAYYRFEGSSAHAAVNPQDGRSALDAMELMNVGVQFLREHVIPDARIHYAITKTGGFSPNVVQSFAEVLYLIRAPKTKQVEEIYQRVNKIAQGAALMTETSLTVEFSKACSDIILNDTLCRVLQEQMEQTSLPDYTDAELRDLRAYSKSTERPILDFVMPLQLKNMIGSASTDVGDVSWICPTAQIMTATWAAETPAHSWQIVAQGKSSFAHKGLLYAGQVLAAAAIAVMENPALLKEAKAEFQRRTGGEPYICPIPQDVKPGKISFE